jgi:catechol 2,3-dioxygenase-like lactoylglutathione lyase family enzyme
MVVKGLIWLGTRTHRYEETVEFAERVLGLGAGQRDEGRAAFELPDGAVFEIFAPTHPGAGHPSSGAVAGFEVDDVGAAYEELVRTGVEVSELHTDGTWRWAYFRAPDDNLYEIVGGPHA